MGKRYLQEGNENLSFKFVCSKFKRLICSRIEIVAFVIFTFFIYFTWCDYKHPFSIWGGVTKFLSTIISLQLRNQKEIFHYQQYLQKVSLQPLFLRIKFPLFPN
jgi:hypothetical protein